MTIENISSSLTVKGFYLAQEEVKETQDNKVISGIASDALKTTAEESLRETNTSLNVSFSDLKKMKSSRLAFEMVKESFPWSSFSSKEITVLSNQLKDNKYRALAAANFPWSLFNSKELVELLKGKEYIGNLMYLKSFPWSSFKKHDLTKLLKDDNYKLTSYALSSEWFPWSIFSKNEILDFLRRGMGHVGDLCNMMGSRNFPWFVFSSKEIEVFLEEMRDNHAADLMQTDNFPWHYLSKEFLFDYIGSHGSCIAGDIVANSSSFPKSLFSEKELSFLLGRSMRNPK
jgi:hypothetical protein